MIAEGCMDSKEVNIKDVHDESEYQEAHKRLIDRHGLLSDPTLSFIKELGETSCMFMEGFHSEEYRDT